MEKDAGFNTHPEHHPPEVSLPQGVWPTMLTPFTRSGGIDWSAFDHLVEWYIEAGVAGLFTVCLSSEMYELGPDERIRLASHVVERASERVPVVAAGAFGDTVEAQAEMAGRLYETGVSAVVLTVNQIAQEDESDDVWRENAEALFEACGNIPLGLYECPLPYHRTLPADVLQWATRSNSVFFYKDTCRSLDLIREKLSAIEDTPVVWFNAHGPTLLDSLKEGGSGYSSIGANFIPALYVWLCEHFIDQPERARALQKFITEAQNTITHKYPACAKHFLQRGGLPIKPHCRVECEALSGEELRALDDLRYEAITWNEEVNDTYKTERGNRPS